MTMEELLDTCRKGTAYPIGINEEDDGSWTVLVCIVEGERTDTVSDLGDSDAAFILMQMLDKALVHWRDKEPLGLKRTKDPHNAAHDYKDEQRSTVDEILQTVTLSDLVGLRLAIMGLIKNAYEQGQRDLISE